ncbi:hypothetical protein M8C13_07180 [Crossiella sp. SN42]|uniref:hypothetical protein n=1 Tax=Crossiella sp. SN42 TaxID=2944808 RepID=UPI00207D5A60|nr:hypothetical protein [Crossiella sp. SN42]MCO1575540.1 hypothetical protein [Crossiella sp. SN42]
MTGSLAGWARPTSLATGPHKGWPLPDAAETPLEQDNGEETTDMATTNSRPGRPGATKMSTDPEDSTSGHLYTVINSCIREALLSFAGFTPCGSYRDSQGWRTATLAEILAEIMIRLHAGLTPAMGEQALESSIRWLRQYLTDEESDRIRAGVEGGDPGSEAAPRLVACAEERDLDPLDLDALVHDLACQAASKINTRGLEALVFFLVQQVGEDEAEQTIRGLVETPNPLCGLDTGLAGCMAEGYDQDLVNEVLDHLSTLGPRLVCVWNSHDRFGYYGDSNFYVHAADGRLHELDGGVWQWLNSDPGTGEPPAVPAPPTSWIGADTGMTTADLGRHDNLHNYARRDHAPGGDSVPWPHRSTGTATGPQQSEQETGRS